MCNILAFLKPIHITTLISWFVARFCTIVNVQGDLVISAIIANKVNKKLDETVFDEVCEFEEQKDNGLEVVDEDEE